MLVPFGWHGPVLAAPGHALYQLNAMAGPHRRAWKVTDDPGQAWVRELWPDLPVDERLL
ncbi:5-deoxy-glucuronate isomerase [Microbacterium sp. bgisy189]|uniref:5-deoxy-glucuronate isomerase n=1 Tax=Microbacterium sp. bgisy189 TaxID=3413798 RepID=UPI003EBE34ED